MKDLLTKDLFIAWGNNDRNTAVIIHVPARYRTDEKRFDKATDLWSYFCKEKGLKYDEMTLIRHTDWPKYGFNYLEHLNCAPVVGEIHRPGILFSGFGRSYNADYQPQ